MKGIRRGNRVSTGWFLLAGLLLLAVGIGLLAELFTTDQDSLSQFNEDEVTARVAVGALLTALGGLSLQIWLISFAVTVGLVETNRRLERLEHLPNMEFYAEQSHGVLTRPSGLRPPPQ
jgi:hypothetical protein